MSTSPSPPPVALRLRQAIPAAQDVLWKYVSTSAGLACWQADEVLGDLENGNFSLKWPGLGARLDLSVERSVPGSALVLRAGATSLELTVSDGLVEMVHRGLDSDDDFDGFESSWRTALSLLKCSVLHHPFRERRVHWLFEETAAPAELLHHYFTEQQALGSWLGTADKTLAEDTSYRIELFGGAAIKGNVLYAERDVCLHVNDWNNGALTMRSLPGQHGGRIAALGVSTWLDKDAVQPARPDYDPPHLDESVVPALEGALSRLAATTLVKES